MRNNGDKNFKKNGGKNNRRGRPNAKQRGRTFDKEDKFSSGSAYAAEEPGTNDVSWYTTNPELLNSAASVNYSWSLGNSINFKVAHGLDTYHAIPGLCAMYVNACPGTSVTPNSAVNIAASKLYGFLRYANSGHSNYEVPDLMMYVLAMDSAMSMFAFAARIYGLANTYSVVNKYLPRTLIEAMGVSFDSIINNLANYRYRLNNLAVKIGSMAIPSSIPLFQRHFWLYSHVFTDNPNMRSQLYMFTPTHTWRMRPVKYETGTALEPVQIYNPTDNTVLSWSDVLDILEDQIEQIVIDEDMNIMSGDILKAFKGEVFKISALPLDYTVLPVYNAEVLTQINNTTALGEVCEDNWQPVTPEFSTQDIYQKDGYLYWNPYFRVKARLPERVYLNMPMDNPTPGDNMVATRLTNTVYREDDVYAGDNDMRYVPTIYNVGSDYCTGWSIWTMDQGGHPEKVTLTSGGEIMDFFPASLLVTPNDVPAFATFIANLSAFRYHPQLYLYHATNVTAGDNIITARGRTTFAGPICELTNYALLSEHDLAKMHDAAILAEYRVPSMGAWDVGK